MKGDEHSGWNIGIAESHDLITWEKVGEIVPEADAVYGEKWPVCPWCIGEKQQSTPYQTYGNSRMMPFATFSEDGIRFERNPTNPIFAPREVGIAGGP